ncbi:MAG: ABC transporter ATP-binding protein [Fimbriimonadaceae bacterium]|nr:ABC transporter ATP-binding protein [Fimbriimonadaceae bacterium]
MAAAIETINLTKSYRTRAGKINVVDNLNLEVEEGEIFGFLGPNGAGKTTTIKMLLGIIYPTTGEAFVLGKEIGDIDVHKLISYLPERPYYYEYMTGLELLRFYASLFGIHDIDLCKRLLEKVNLHKDMTKTISQYSKGMQQRVGLAQSLLNDPKLLFLDEPTGGLDPIAHKEIRDLILQFKGEGRTVFVSSHEMSEVERICDRVAIINHGRIERQGKLSDLLRGELVEITAEGVSVDWVGGLGLNGAKVLPFESDGVLIELNDTHDHNAVIDSIRTQKGKIVQVVRRRKYLEDLFVETVSSAAPGPGGKK